MAGVATEREAQAAAAVASDRTVALIGFMGCGKSTVGPALAGALGRAFVDTDTEVVARLGRSIPELFAAGDERLFRAEEAAVVTECVVRTPPVVAALGGGAFEDPGVRTLLLERACVVYLEVAWETLRPMLAELAEGRPLLAGAGDAALAALFARRAVSYAHAPVRVAVSYDGVAATLARVLAAIAVAG